MVCCGGKSYIYFSLIVSCLQSLKILALSYGISFWIVPSLSACGAVVATQLGDSTKAAWYVSLYTITVTIAFMVCGANSDLFGRRWFIVGGNAILFVGFIVGGTAKDNTSMLVAMSLIGFVRHPRLVRLRYADYKCRVPVMRRSVYIGDLEHVFIY
jgi:MFS family permease